MKVFEFAAVRRRCGSAAKKTKRLHWFNFGLLFGSTSLHGGYIGHMCSVGWFTWWIYEECRGSRVGFCTDFFVPVLDFDLFKRLQIAVICVYLRKIYEYETDQMHHRSLDRQA